MSRAGFPTLVNYCAFVGSYYHKPTHLWNSTLLEMILVSREKGLRASGAGAGAGSGSSSGPGSGSSDADSDSDSNSNAPSQMVLLPPSRGPADAAAHIFRI